MNQTDGKHEDEGGILREIREALRTIRYGSLQIIVQDGKVVQIDRTEKIRFAHKRGRDA